MSELKMKAVQIDASGRGAICTAAGCEDTRKPKWKAMVWCPRCGNARCPDHLSEGTGLRCCDLDARSAPHE